MKNEEEEEEELRFDGLDLIFSPKYTRHHVSFSYETNMDSISLVKVRFCDSIQRKCFIISDSKCFWMVFWLLSPT